MKKTENILKSLEIAELFSEKTVKNWESRQFFSDNSAERSRVSRSKTQKCNVAATLQQRRNVDACNDAATLQQRPRYRYRTDPDTYTEHNTNRTEQNARETDTDADAKTERAEDVVCDVVAVRGKYKFSESMLFNARMRFGYFQRGERSDDEQFLKQMLEIYGYKKLMAAISDLSENDDGNIKNHKGLLRSVLAARDE
jgi:hypothetical protein